jgi:integrase
VALGIQAHNRAGTVPDPKLLPTIGALRVPFLARRETTHRAGRQDRQRWDIHQAATFDPLRPGEVTQGIIKAWARERRAAGCSGSSLRVMMATLSGLFEELRDAGALTANPTHDLPESVRSLIRSGHDPETTPFVERLEDVRRILLALPRHVARVYALGAFVGLRPAEARALAWSSVDLDRKVIHVTRQVLPDGTFATLKDKEGRTVPVMDELGPLLATWRLELGGKGLVCPPGPRTRGRGTMYRGTPNLALTPVLGALGLERPGLDWYGATRHTFASHFVLRGGSLEQLSKILGHSSIAMTERYAHLRPDQFTAQVRGLFGAGDWRFSGDVVALPVPAVETRAGRKARPRKD